MNTRVNFELAKLLKEKGFDEKVRGRYCIKNATPFKVGLFYLSDYELSGEFIYGPTIAETIMWLYEKHGIWVYVDFYNENRWFGVFRNKEGVKTELFDVFNSPTEAYEAAIEYTLKNLI